MTNDSEELARLKDVNASLKAALRRLEASELHQTCKALEAELVSARGEIDRLQLLVDEKPADERSDAVEALTVRVGELEDQLNDRKAELAELRQLKRTNHSLEERERKLNVDLGAYGISVRFDEERGRWDVNMAS